MSYSAGYLDTRVKVLTCTDYANDDYTLAGSMWAHVIHQSGRQQLIHGDIFNGQTIAINCHCHPFLKEEQRLQIDGHTYRITSFDERKRQNEVTIVAERV